MEWCEPAFLATWAEQQCVLVQNSWAFQRKKHFSDWFQVYKFQIQSDKAFLVHKARLSQSASSSSHEHFPATCTRATAGGEPGCAQQNEELPALQAWLSAAHRLPFASLQPQKAQRPGHWWSCGPPASPSLPHPHSSELPSAVPRAWSRQAPLLSSLLELRDLLTAGACCSGCATFVCKEMGCLCLF